MNPHILKIHPHLRITQSLYPILKPWNATSADPNELLKLPHVAYISPSVSWWNQLNPGESLTFLLFFAKSPFFSVILGERSPVHPLSSPPAVLRSRWIRCSASPWECCAPRSRPARPRRSQRSGWYIAETWWVFREKRTLWWFNLRKRKAIYRGFCWGGLLLVDGSCWIYGSVSWWFWNLCWSCFVAWNGWCFLCFMASFGWWSLVVVQSRGSISMDCVLRGRYGDWDKNGV